MNRQFWLDAAAGRPGRAGRRLDSNALPEIAAERIEVGSIDHAIAVPVEGRVVGGTALAGAEGLSEGEEVGSVDGPIAVDIPEQPVQRCQAVPAGGTVGVAVELVVVG